MIDDKCLRQLNGYIWCLGEATIDLRKIAREIVRSVKSGDQSEGGRVAGDRQS